MAIPSPPVIYQEPDMRAALLGKALGELGSSLATSWNQRDALQQSANMPPDQQANYLAQRLGPQGLDFVKSLAQLKASQAEIERTKVDTQNAITLGAISQKKLASFDREQALSDEVEKAKIDAERATAAGQYSRAATARAELGVASQRLKMEQQSSALTDMVTLEKLKALRQNSAAADAFMQQFGSKGQPQTGGGGAVIQPQSFTPGQGSPSATFRPISDTTAQASGSASDETGSGDQTPAARLQLIQQVDQKGDLGRGIPPVQLTQDQVGEIAALMREGKMDKAYEAKQAAQQPTKTFPVQIAPGVKVEVGLYADGKTRPIPGTTEDVRKPADTQLREVSGGASLWYNTSQLLKQLGDADPTKTGSDVLGTAVVRRLNQVLQQHGLQPVGDQSSRDIREAYKTVYDHNIIGITSLMRGVRQTQQLRNQLQDTAPKPTDTKEIRDQKLKATQLTAAVLIKNEVETAIDGGMRVPPTLLQVYKDMGLENQDLGDLQKQYLDTFKGLGINAPASLDQSSTGDSTPAGAGSSQTPAKSGSSGAAGSNGLPPGWSVKVSP